MRALVLFLMALAAMPSQLSAQSPKSDQAVQACIEGLAIPGITPARTLKVGNDPKVHDLTMTRPDPTRGRVFTWRKGLKDYLQQAAVLTGLEDQVKKCES